MTARKRRGTEAGRFEPFFLTASTIRRGTECHPLVGVTATVTETGTVTATATRSPGR